MSPTPFADAAVGYAERGWRVFQIPAGQKIPRVRWKHGEAGEIATSNVAMVRSRAAIPAVAACNIGIATGEGLAVLDVDPQHGGEVPAWAPPTLTARTPSGGAHLYYAVDGHVPNSAGKLAPGVDVRGDGGMVLAPPSRIETGFEWRDGKDAATYSWVDPEHPVHHFGDGAMLVPARHQRTPGPRLAARTFGEGERHDAMLALAGKMRSIGCELPEITAALFELNRTRFEPMLGSEWVLKVSRSIMQYAPDSELLP
jgi:putative DNA primase/helicase